MMTKKNHKAIPRPLPGIRQNSKVTSIRKLKARTYTLMIMKFYSCCHRLDGFYWSMLRTSDMQFRSWSRTYRQQVQLSPIDFILTREFLLILANSLMSYYLLHVQAVRIFHHRPVRKHVRQCTGNINRNFMKSGTKTRPLHG